MILEAHRLIVVQIDRRGYLCSCGELHRDHDPLFEAHVSMSTNWRTWTETNAWVVQKDGQVVRVSAAIAHGAMAAIDSL